MLYPVDVSLQVALFGTLTPLRLSVSMAKTTSQRHSERGYQNPTHVSNTKFALVSAKSCQNMLHRQRCCKPTHRDVDQATLFERGFCLELCAMECTPARLSKRLQTQTLRGPRIAFKPQNRAEPNLPMGHNLLFHALLGNTSFCQSSRPLEIELCSA